MKGVYQDHQLRLRHRHLRNHRHLQTPLKIMIVVPPAHPPLYLTDRRLSILFFFLSIINNSFSIRFLCQFALLFYHNNTHTFLDTSPSLSVLCVNTKRIENHELLSHQSNLQNWRRCTKRRLTSATRKGQRFQMT